MFKRNDAAMNSSSEKALRPYEAAALLGTTRNDIVRAMDRGDLMWKSYRGRKFTTINWVIDWERRGR